MFKCLQIAIYIWFFLCTSQYSQSLFHICAAFIPSTYKLEVFGNFIQVKFKKKLSWLTEPWCKAATVKQLRWLSELARSIRGDYGIYYSDKNWDFTKAEMINSSKVRKPRKFTKLNIKADMCFENTSVLACFARYQVPQAALIPCWISLSLCKTHDCKHDLIRAQTLSDNLFPGELAIIFSS